MQVFWSRSVVFHFLTFFRSQGRNLYIAISCDYFGTANTASGISLLASMVTEQNTNRQNLRRTS